MIYIIKVIVNIRDIVGLFKKLICNKIINIYRRNFSDNIYFLSFKVNYFFGGMF